MFRHIFPKIRIVKFANSLPQLRAETSWKHEETVLIYHKKTGDGRTADHKVFHEENESRLQHRYGVVVQDLFSYWIQCNFAKNKTAQETIKTLQKSCR